MGFAACAPGQMQRALGQRWSLQARGRAWLCRVPPPWRRCPTGAEASRRAVDHERGPCVAEAARVAGRSGGAVPRAGRDRSRSPRPRRSRSTQAIKIVPAEDDPVIRFFEEAFSDPNNWEESPPQPAIEERLIDPEVEPVEAVIVEPEGEPADDTPPRVAEMIKSGAFDRKPGQ
jgi:hypothetical protein